MATSEKPVEGNTTVKSTTTSGDHDRVTMLSLRADGTPDQLNPEIIGDKEAAIVAAREQFAQQAVSSVDVTKRADLGLLPTAGEPTGDVITDELKAEHDKVAAAAEKKAESVIESLHQG